ncbi:MAG: hypothetical protein ACKVJU_12350 [Verrucomicrobiales bacterium]
MANDFRPGFRFSILDAVILLAGSLYATQLIIKGIYFPGIMVANIVGHFFLFCNVFRICRRSELIWAAAIVLLSIASTFINVTTSRTIAIPSAVVVISVLLAAYFIAFETRKPSYHGIFWKKWNPDLKSWWEEQSKAQIP